MSKELIPENLETKIYTIRGQKVMLDSDLAELYGVETKRLNEQVSRNIDRFPADFMFKLTIEEANILRSQFATLPTSSWQVFGRWHDVIQENRPARSRK